MSPLELLRIIPLDKGKELSVEEKAALDEWYVRNASFLVDMRIVLKTLGLALTSRLSSREMAAVAEQVRSKTLDLVAPSDQWTTGKRGSMS